VPRPSSSLGTGSRLSQAYVGLYMFITILNWYLGCLDLFFDIWVCFGVYGHIHITYIYIERERGGYMDIFFRSLTFSKSLFCLQGGPGRNSFAESRIILDSS